MMAYYSVWYHRFHSHLCPGGIIRKFLTPETNFATHLCNHYLFFAKKTGLDIIFFSKLAPDNVYWPQPSQITRNKSPGIQSRRSPPPAVGSMALSYKLGNVSTGIPIKGQSIQYYTIPPSGWASWGIFAWQSLKLAFPSGSSDFVRSRSVRELTILRNITWFQ